MKKLIFLFLVSGVSFLSGSTIDHVDNIVIKNNKCCQFSVTLFRDFNPPESENLGTMLLSTNNEEMDFSKNVQDAFIKIIVHPLLKDNFSQEHKGKYRMLYSSGKSDIGNLLDIIFSFDNTMQQKTQLDLSLNLYKYGFFENKVGLKIDDKIDPEQINLIHPSKLYTLSFIGKAKEKVDDFLKVINADEKKSIDIEYISDDEDDDNQGVSEPGTKPLEKNLTKSLNLAGKSVYKIPKIIIDTKLNSNLWRARNDLKKINYWTEVEPGDGVNENLENIFNELRKSNSPNPIS